MWAKKYQQVQACLRQELNAAGPCRAARWVASWAVPGLGMFNESYYIFSVGNIKPIWTEEYPSCWRVRTCAGMPLLWICMSTGVGTTVWACASKAARNAVAKHALCRLVILMCILLITQDALPCSDEA